MKFLANFSLKLEYLKHPHSPDQINRNAMVHQTQKQLNLKLFECHPQSNIYPCSIK